MKTISPVSIWDNGTVQQATILNSYAVNVTLNTYATFWYGLFAENADTSQGAQLAQGNLSMTGEASFTPYDEVTKEMVEGWLAAGLDTEAIEANLDAQIQNFLSPPIVAYALPWQ